jgi:hypothetical protein
MVVSLLATLILPGLAAYIWNETLWSKRTEMERQVDTLAQRKRRRR